jgi:hypothetical protein
MDDCHLNYITKLKMKEKHYSQLGVGVSFHGTNAVTNGAESAVVKIHPSRFCPI